QILTLDAPSTPRRKKSGAVTRNSSFSEFFVNLNALPFSHQRKPLMLTAEDALHAIQDRNCGVGVGHFSRIGCARSLAGARRKSGIDGSHHGRTVATKNFGRSATAADRINARGR